MQSLHLKKSLYFSIKNTHKKTGIFPKILQTATLLSLLLLPLSSFSSKKNFEKLDTWFSFEPGQEFEIEGSKSLIKDKSSTQYYNNIALPLRLSDLSENSFGAKFSWDRRGSHFVDFVPKGEKKMIGSFLEKAFLWVWGGNYRHELGIVFVRPKDGMSYIASFGPLSFYGWKQLEAGVPPLVSYDYKAYDPDKIYRFDRFRIYSHPREPVDNIYVFLDNLQFKSHLQENFFDGADLTKVIRKEMSKKQDDLQQTKQEAGASQADEPSSTSPQGQ